jgi:hypothetical protein
MASPLISLRWSSIGKFSESELAFLLCNIARAHHSAKCWKVDPLSPPTPHPSPFLPPSLQLPEYGTSQELRTTAESTAETTEVNTSQLPSQIALNNASKIEDDPLLKPNRKWEVCKAPVLETPNTAHATI